MLPATVDRYMTDLCTRKEGRSIRSYWSPGSMKGQRIHNAEATSQHPPIASWCASSALKLVKMGMCVWERETKWALLVASAEKYAWISPPSCHQREWAFMFGVFTVSEVPGQPTFVSTAWINSCWADLLHRRHLELRDLGSARNYSLREIYGFRLRSG